MTLKVPTIRLSVQDCTVVLLFLAILLVNINSSHLIKYCYYLALAGCFIVLLIDRVEFPILVIGLAGGALILGLLNYSFVGNITLVKLLILLSGFYVAILFLNKGTSSNAFLFSVILNGVVALYKMAVNGVSAPVYLEVSNNYISVFLLATLVMYYMKRELEDASIPIWPVVFAWIVSFFGGSRSGVIAISALFVGILIYRYLNSSSNRTNKLLLLIIVMVLAIAILVLLLPLFAESLSNYRVVSRFISMGFESSARLRIWSEYGELLKDGKNLMLGAPLGEVYWAARFYNGNLHNSFLFVHAFLGIIGFLVMVVLIINSIRFAFINHRYVFLITFFSFSLRTMTDHVFGCNRLTPVFLCFLIYPFLVKLIELKRKRLHQASCELSSVKAY